MAPLFQSPAARLAALRREHPQLEHVPDGAIRFGAHNPGGPPVHLQMPPHPGPLIETAEAGAGRTDHILDLSTEGFEIGGQQYDIGRHGAAARARTLSDVRNYVALTNTYLQGTGPRTVTRTERRGKGTVGAKASEISRKERKGKTAYNDVGQQKIYAGHVPDPMISGVAHSPMGFLPMSDDANTIVGGASGLARRSSPLARLLVRETGGQLHHYGLPAVQPSATGVSGSGSVGSPSAAGTGSSSSSSSSSSSGSSSSAASPATSVASQASSAPAAASPSPSPSSGGVAAAALAAAMTTSASSSSSSSLSSPSSSSSSSPISSSSSSSSSSSAGSASSAGSSQLTDAQRAQIERNRHAALERRRQLHKQRENR